MLVFMRRWCIRKMMTPGHDLGKIKLARPSNKRSQSSPAFEVSAPGADTVYSWALRNAWLVRLNPALLSVIFVTFKTERVSALESRSSRPQTCTVRNKEDWKENIVPKISERRFEVYIRAKDPSGRSLSRILWHEVPRSISTCPPTHPPPPTRTHTSLNGMLVPSRVTTSIKFAGTHLYTWVETGTMRAKCLARKHNTVPDHDSRLDRLIWRGVY